MLVSNKSKALRNIAWKPHLAMVLVQVINGGYHVISKAVLNAGINQMVLCTFRDLIALSILAPIAFVLDRGARPPLTSRLLLSFFFLGLTGVLGNQLLFLFGLGYTNPTYAAAMQPAIPVFTLILSSIMGVERVNIRRKEFWIKVFGTSLCVSGAAVMLIYRGSALFGDCMSHSKLGVVRFKRDEWLGSSLLKFEISFWHIGVLCLIGNCICMAAFLVLQAPILLEYPANLSLTAYTYFFGVLLMVPLGLSTATDATDWILTKSEIIAVLYSGIFSSAVNYGLMTWSNKIIGPSLVALYTPLQLAASAFLSAIFIGSSIFLGSVVGGVLIICGLYLVIWALHSESEESLATTYKDLISEPLLHDDASSIIVRESSLMAS